MPIKSVKMKKKMRFFLMSQGSLNPKIRFLAQKMYSVAIDTQTRKWLLRAPFQGFRSFSFNLSSRIGPIYSQITTYSKVVNYRPHKAWRFIRLNTRSMAVYINRHDTSWEYISDTSDSRDWLCVNTLCSVSYPVIKTTHCYILKPSGIRCIWCISSTPLTYTI